MRELEALLSALMAYYFIALILGVVIAVVCGVLARRKGRGVVRWVIASLFFGIIPLIILALLPDITYDYDERYDYSERMRNTDCMANLRNSETIGKIWICPSCGTENSGGKDFCCNCSAYNSQKKSKEEAKKEIDTPEYQDKEWICDCGTKNEGNRSFCKNCRQMKYLSK